MEEGQLGTEVDPTVTAIFGFVKVWDVYVLVGLTPNEQEVCKGSGKLK